MRSAVLASSNLLNEVAYVFFFRYFEVPVRVRYRRKKKFTFAISSPDEILYRVLAAYPAKGRPGYRTAGPPTPPHLSALSAPLS